MGTKNVNVNFLLSDIDGNKRENIEISILNDLGQVIQKYNRNTNFILEETNLEHLVSDLFFVKIKTKNGVVVKRVIVQK